MVSSGTPSEADAKQFFTEKLGTIKEGLAKIDSFKKTNGVKHVKDGAEEYTLDYEMELVYPKGWNAQCVDTSHFHMECLQAQINQATRAVGAREKMVGKLIFEKTEKGWRVVDHHRAG
jgi:hypothetical protein